MSVVFVLTLATSAAQDPPPPEEEEVAAEELVVTGTRTPRRMGEAPVAVEVVTRADIEASGAEDVADVLEQHPGVGVDRGLFGATVRLRGLNPEHVLILVDGQRVVGRKDGTFDLSRLPVDAIERIEIVKGASSALYGSDAMGGVINIITRRTQDQVEGSVHARGGSLSTLDTSVGFGTRSDDAGLRLDAGWHSNGAQDLAPETPDTDISGLQQLDLAAAGDWTPGPDVTLRLSGSYALQDSGGVDLGLGGAILDRRNVTEDVLGRLVSDWAVGQASNWSNAVGLSMYRDQFLNDQRDAGALDEYQETRETLVQLTSQVDHTAGPHRLTIGGEGFLSLLSSARLEGGTGNRQRGGVYVQDEILVSRSPRFAAVPGIRLDADSWFGSAVAPKLGLRFDPIGTLTLRASAGTGWRSPEFRELLLSFDNPGAGYRIEGNPDLVPERSAGATVGLEWVPEDRFSVSLSGWYDRLDDLIQIGTLDEGPGQTLFGYVNIAEAQTQGLEAAVSFEPTTWFGLDLSGTLTDATDLSTGDPLEGRAPIQGTASMHLRIPVHRGPRITTRASAFGPRPFYEEQGGGEVRVDAEPYVLMDLRLAVPAIDELTFFAGIDNVLDAGDAEYLQVPPRLLYAGLDARLPRRDAKREVSK